MKLPKESSSSDSHHGRKEREIMGKSEKENPKGSDPYKKVEKEASKEKILWTDILKDEHNELDENKGLGRFMKT